MLKLLKLLCQLSIKTTDFIVKYTGSRLIANLLSINVSNRVFLMFLIKLSMFHTIKKLTIRLFPILNAQLSINSKNEDMKHLIVLKKTITSLVILSVVFAIALICPLLLKTNPSGDYIAHLVFRGEISGSYEKDIQIIKKIREDDNAKAVILTVDSGGGEVGSSELLMQAFDSLANKKLLIVSMERVAASGGYLISLPAKLIFAMHSTMTCSIGVIGQAYNFVEAAEKLGIQLKTIKTSALKGGLTPFEKFSDESIEAEKLIIDNVYQFFINNVSFFRKIPLEEVKKFANGGVCLGEKAVEMKLIDGIGYYEDILIWIKKDLKLPQETRDVYIALNQKESGAIAIIKQTIQSIVNVMNDSKILLSH